MRQLTRNIWADFDRETLLITWRWEVIEAGRVILGSIADSRAEAEEFCEDLITNLTRRQCA